MLRRIVLVLTTAAVMVAMMIATALPAFAGATSYTGDVCLTNGGSTFNSKDVVTPSGNSNLHCHFHPNGSKGDVPVV